MIWCLFSIIMDTIIIHCSSMSVYPLQHDVYSMRKIFIHLICCLSTILPCLCSLFTCYINMCFYVWKSYLLILPDSLLSTDDFVFFMHITIRMMTKMMTPSTAATTVPTSTLNLTLKQRITEETPGYTSNHHRNNGGSGSMLDCRSTGWLILHLGHDSFQNSSY